MKSVTKSSIFNNNAQTYVSRKLCYSHEYKDLNNSSNVDWKTTLESKFIKK